MRVLLGCECSGVVRRAFRKRGHDAWSCDLLPAEDGSEFHLQCDVLGVLDRHWDLAIFFPPCTHLAVSGARYFSSKSALQKEAVEFARRLLHAPIYRVALENPVGVLSRYIRKPDQIIQPYQFGDNASKKTCLWLSYLYPLEPTKIVKPVYYTDKGLPRYANQTPSGQNKLAPSERRAADRGRTYPGIAAAMADQWGDMLC